MNTLVSVIVPIYNVENYLKRCVDSILAQTYKNLEIILVDDGSTDHSGLICDGYVGRDARIKVIHKKNGGLSDARNCGLDQATGAYYCFIDSDDYIMQNTIQNMYENMNNNNSEIAVCNMIRFFDNGEKQVFYKPVDKIQMLYGEERFQTLRQPSVCNKLFKAELFHNLRFPKGKFYEDTYIYHVLADRSKCIVLTGFDGYWYYARQDSILGQPIYTERYFDFIEAVWLRTKYLSEKKIEVYAQEAALSLYAAYANAVKNIVKTEKNEKFFMKAKEQFLYSYELLMNSSYINVKQRIRLLMLKYLPKIHTMVY